MDTLINDVSLNDENEMTTLLVLAEYGNAKAQYRLALRYKNGHGVTRDDAKALEWFHASATNGYACPLQYSGVVLCLALSVPSSSQFHSLTVIFRKIYNITASYFFQFF